VLGFLVAFFSGSYLLKFNGGERNFIGTGMCDYLIDFNDEYEDNLAHALF